MSRTPVSYASPTRPATYTWEATNEEVSARYGIPVEEVARFDLNTSPAPPDLAARLLAAGRFETSLSEYPPSDYRRLVAAAAARYGVEPEQILVGAGADEIIDILAKAFIPAGGSAVIPVPTYAMYRVNTEQRGATVVAVPRRPASDGWALDIDATAAAAATASVVWLCSPNNPTGVPEPDGAIESLLARLLADATTEGRPAPVVVLDEAYAEFVGTSAHPLQAGYPNLVVVRTASKAYALAGLRVGFAIARPELIARMSPYRPPGSVSTVSVTVVTEALLDPRILDANLERVARERTRLTDALRAVGWSRRPVGHELHPRRLRHARTGRRRGRGPAPTRPRPADVPRRASGRGVPAPHGPRRRRERPPDRGRHGPRSGGHTMTTPLGELSIGPREGRRVTVARTTRETDITVTLGLDGSGHTSIDTGVGFYDHLLSSFGHHGLFDLAIASDGDLQVDEHHTVEDVALVLGAAFGEALGDRAGIRRFGQASVPMDESLATAVVDAGGRPYAVIDLPFRGERIGGLPTQLVEHALEAFARTAGTTLHLHGSGRNDHHLAEAAFKALAYAMRTACEPDPRRDGVASTKGALG